MTVGDISQRIQYRRAARKKTNSLKDCCEMWGWTTDDDELKNENIDGERDAAAANKNESMNENEGWNQEQWMGVQKVARSPKKGINFSAKERNKLACSNLVAPNTRISSSPWADGLALTLPVSTQRSHRWEGINCLPQGSTTQEEKSFQMWVNEMNRSLQMH